MSRVCETAGCSILAHAAGAVALVVIPLLLSSALPHPSGVVHAFFVDPMTVPPPPPPPPPSPAAVAVRKAPARVTPPSETYFAPVEIPSELSPDEGLDLTVEGGSSRAGGVEGGVPGGVVGGVVGGLPEIAPPSPVQAFRVGGDIKKPVKIKHVAPTYPDLATKAQIQGIVIIEARAHPRKLRPCRSLGSAPRAGLLPGGVSRPGGPRTRTSCVTSGPGPRPPLRLGAIAPSAAPAFRWPRSAASPPPALG